MTKTTLYRSEVRAKQSMSPSVATKPRDTLRHTCIFDLFIRFCHRCLRFYANTVDLG